MKISIEAKIGIIGLVSIAVLIWGINYLKGRNILRSTYLLHALYQDAGGLESSAPVMMRGMKIGYVDQIIYLPDKDPPILVNLSIEKEYDVPSGSLAELISADLLGTRAIRINRGTGSGTLDHHDTIPSKIVPDMLANLQKSILPVMERVSSLAYTIDSLALSARLLMESGPVKESLENIAGLTASLKASLEEGGSLGEALDNVRSFTAMLEEQQEEFATVIRHLDTLGSQLADAEINRVAQSMEHSLDELAILLEQVNSGEGSAGRLLYSESLYNSLDSLARDLGRFIRDLRENPEDYVHFSLFGRSGKE